MRALHGNLKAIAQDFIRDVDAASHHDAEVSSASPTKGVVLDRFDQLVQMKLASPLAKLDSAREDMEKFL